MSTDRKPSKKPTTSYKYDEVKPYFRQKAFADTTRYDFKQKKGRKIGFYNVTKTIAIAVLVIVVLVFFGSIFFKSKTVTLDEETVYGVVIGEYVTESTANYYSMVCKSRGGAGGVYRDDGKYMLFAALYLSKADATAVANKLLESGESAYVYEFTLPETTIRCEGGTRYQLRELTTVFYDVLEELLTVVLEYDSDTRNSGDISLDIVRMTEMTDEAILSVEKLSASAEKDKNVTAIKTFLASQKTILSRLADGVVRSTDLKIAYFDLLLLNKEFRDRFGK